MGDALKRVQRGQKLQIPAAAYNAFVDAARDFQQRQRSNAQSAQAAAVNSGVVLVKNTSGDDRDRFDVLGVDVPIYGPADNLESFKNKIALKGVIPTTNHAGKFVILLEPLKANAIGRAVASGVSVVRINVQNEADKIADVADGQAGYLTSSSSGVAQTLWKESGTGVKWAVVRIGGGGGSALPIGEYQGDVWTMVSQNEADWDRVRFTPP